MIALSPSDITDGKNCISNKCKIARRFFFKKKKSSGFFIFLAFAETLSHAPYFCERPREVAQASPASLAEPASQLHFRRIQFPNGFVGSGGCLFIVLSIRVTHTGESVPLVNPGLKLDPSGSLL